jgi:hypothetical protein
MKEKKSKAESFLETKPKPQKVNCYSLKVLKYVAKKYLSVKCLK